MIAAFDVHYLEDGSASAAVVLFSDYRDSEPMESYTHILTKTEEYIPGEFYRRELPCILTMLNQIKEEPDEIVIDGYVMLADKPGLGWHIFESLKRRIPVIGVAKSEFFGAKAAKVFRGRSTNPLYVTSAGVNLKDASEKIRLMHGPYRIPTMLKRVDLLAKKVQYRLNEMKNRP